MVEIMSVPFTVRTMLLMKGDVEVVPLSVDVPTFNPKEPTEAVEVKVAPTDTPVRVEPETF